MVTMIKILTSWTYTSLELTKVIIHRVAMFPTCHKINHSDHMACHPGAVSAGW